MSVSICIPNYNNGPWIAECIGSLGNDPAVAEIVVCDDGSIDNSLAVLESLNDPRIRIILGDHRGAFAARTRAVEAASSPLIYLLDGDDRLAAGTVSAAVNAAGSDMTIPEMVRFDDNGTYPFIAAPPRMSGDEAFKRTLGSWRIHPMGLMTRDLYLSVAMRFRAKGYSADELFTRHLFLACESVGPCEGQYQYRIVEKQAGSRLKTQLSTIALAARQGFWRESLSMIRNLMR